MGLNVFRRIYEWWDNMPTMHKHEVTELTESYRNHRYERFSWTTVHRRWWCPICERSWAQWHFLNLQNRQIFDHVQKLKVDKLDKEMTQLKTETDEWYEKIRALKEQMKGTK